MKWHVVLSTRAKRDLSRLDEKTTRRILDATDCLAADEAADVKKLRGREGQWRLRVGNYRVLFRRNTEAREIGVIRILDRRDAYR